MSDAGWLWIVTDVVAVVILAGAMIYGAAMWRKRSQDPALKRASDEATRKLYRCPDPVDEKGIFPR